KEPAGRFQAPTEVAEALRPFTLGSKLGRLLGVDGAAAAPVGDPAAEIPTPAPGSWKTTSERGGRRLPGGPSRIALPAVPAGVCLLLVVAWLLWPSFDGGSRPAAQPLVITEMHVTHFRDKGTALVGDLRTSPGTVRLNDDVRVSAQLSAPAYCYL